VSGAGQIDPVVLETLRDSWPRPIVRIHLDEVEGLGSPSSLRGRHRSACCWRGPRARRLTRCYARGCSNRWGCATPASGQIRSGASRSPAFEGHIIY